MGEGEKPGKDFSVFFPFRGFTEKNYTYLLSGLLNSFVANHQF